MHVNVNMAVNEQYHYSARILFAFYSLWKKEERAAGIKLTPLECSIDEHDYVKDRRNPIKWRFIYNEHVLRPVDLDGTI